MYRYYAFSETALRKSGPYGAAEEARSQKLNVPVGYGYLSCMPDQLSDQYADLLTGTYDCVDRIIVNAYFPKRG